MERNAIEISGTRRFTESELKAKLRESRAYWASPAGIKCQAQLDAERRNRKLQTTKFPGLAGTKPKLTGGEARTAHAKAILARVEKNKPQI